jgi:hypothetical protein
MEANAAESVAHALNCRHEQPISGGSVLARERCESMEVAGVVLMMIVVVGVALCVAGIPGYVLAKRRGLRNPIVAFVPFVGFWIVLFESLGKSGWLGMLAFVPYVGFLVLPVWTGIEIPAHHGRTRWWTAILAIPLLNLVGYWAYAFTLPKHVSPVGQELQEVVV